MKLTKISLVFVGGYFFSAINSMEEPSDLHLKRSSRDLIKASQLLNNAEQIISGMDRTLIVTSLTPTIKNNYVNEKLEQAAQLTNESKNLVEQAMESSSDSPEIQKRGEESLCRVEEIVKRSNSRPNDQLDKHFNRRLSNGRAINRTLPK